MSDLQLVQDFLYRLLDTKFDDFWVNVLAALFLASVTTFAGFFFLRFKTIQIYSGQWQGEIRAYKAGKVVNDEWINLKLAMNRRSNGRGIGLVFFERHIRKNQSEWTAVLGVDEIDSICTKLPLIRSKFQLNLKSRCVFNKIDDGDWVIAESVPPSPLNCQLVTPRSSKSTLTVAIELPLIGSDEKTLLTWQGELTKLD